MLVRSRTLIDMKRPVLLAAVVAGLIAALPALQSSAGHLPALSAPATQQHVAQVAAPSVRFEPNQGQSDPSVLYIARMGQSAFYFKQGEVMMALSAQALVPGATGAQQQSSPDLVKMQFMGGSNATLSAVEPLASKVNYISGNNPADWRTGIPTYGGVNYANLYSGIDLRYDGSAAELKGTYTISPNANPALIRWQYSGAGKVTLSASGSLYIASGSGALTESAPVAWQDLNGKRVPVKASYAVSDAGVVSFAIGSYDRAQPLVIDPALQYSSYLGGTGDDSANDVAADANSSTYVVGLTVSANFPVLNPYQGTSGGATDLFISKFNPNGTLAYSTYLGGAGDDYGYGIAVDSSGAVYVTGRTQSSNFPSSNAYQPAPGGNLDAFISKLSADGQTLLYSSYLGGSGTDVGWGVAADDNGNAYISGSSNSTNFPVRNAFQGTFGGGANDAFITRINTTATGDASLIYSTYMGGSQSDYSGGSGVSALGHGIAADSSGHAYVTGSSNSDNFPILNGFQTARVNDFDVFAAKLDTNASGATSLMYSTYLGGNNGDFGRDIAVDGAGNAYIAGDEAFSNFPTRNAYGQCGSGPFVAKFNMALTGDASLIYSTCFGTLAHGSAVAVAVEGNGNAVIAGFSSSNTWPLVNQIMGYSGGVDVIVAKLNQAGNNLVYSTYLGGSANDSAYGVAVSTIAGASHTYVAGSTTSINYPTVNAFQGTNAGAADGFISDINEPAVPPSPTPSATTPPTSTPTRTPSPIPTATRPPTSTPTRTPSPTSTPVVCRPNFSDVQQSDYFYQAVQYLYCHNVISGYADGTFRPYNNTTRGQMTKIVVLGFNLPVYTPTGPTFTDVPLGSTFYNYVETAVQDGIVAGYGCGGPGEPCPGQYFRPGANVTRGQLSKIVVIAASQVRGWEIISPPQATFSDVPVGSTFYNYVETAVRHGLISGYGCGGPGEPCPGQYFRPGNSATRGQISKIVYLAITGQIVNRQANK